MVEGYTIVEIDTLAGRVRVPVLEICLAGRLWWLHESIGESGWTVTDPHTGRWSGWGLIWTEAIDAAELRLAHTTPEQLETAIKEATKEVMPYA